MFELRVKMEFPAAHHLTGYPGDCARPHGHNWGVEVFARSKGLDELGMAIDFRDLKNAVKEIIAGWDHQDLNVLEDFSGINPSAENIAKLTYDRLSMRMKGKTTWIDRVTIWENERCSASYFLDQSEKPN
jgi:6-pyruvoyltetrahydropterin/6-carboxytetrahydropterin synthase